MPTSPQDHRLSLPNTPCSRQFAFSPPPRRPPRHLFRDGSIGSGSDCIVPKTANFNSIHDTNSSFCPHPAESDAVKENNALEVPSLSPLTPLPTFGRRSTGFASPFAGSATYVQSINATHLSSSINSGQAGPPPREPTHTETSHLSLVLSVSTSSMGSPTTSHVTASTLQNLISNPQPCLSERPETCQGQESILPPLTNMTPSDQSSERQASQASLSIQSRVSDSSVDQVHDVCATRPQFPATHTPSLLTENSCVAALDVNNGDERQRLPGHQRTLHKLGDHEKQRSCFSSQLSGEHHNQVIHSAAQLEDNQTESRRSLQEFGNMTEEYGTLYQPTPWNSVYATNDILSLSISQQPSHATHALHAVDSTLRTKDMQLLAMRCKLEETFTGFEQASKRVKDLQADYRRLLAAHSELKGTLMERITSIQHRYIETTNELEGTRNQLKELKAKLDILPENMRDMNEDRVNISHRHEALYRTLSKIQDDRAAEKAAMVNRIEELASNCSTTQALCTKMDEEITVNVRRFVDCSGKIWNLCEQAHRYDTLTRILTAVESRCEQYDISTRELETKVADQKHSIHVLTSDLGQRDRRVQELEVALQSAEDLAQSNCRFKEVECEALRLQVENWTQEYKRCQTDLVRSNDELLEARQSLVHLETNVSLIEGTPAPCTVTVGVGTADDPGVDLNAQLVNLQQALHDMQSTRGEEIKRINSLSSELRFTLDEKAALSKQLQENMASEKATRKQVGEFQASEGLIRDRLAVIEQENISLRNYAEDNERKISSMVQDYQQQITYIQTHASSESSNQTQRAASQIQGLQRKLEEVTKERDQISKQWDEKNTELYQVSELLASKDMDLVSANAKIRRMELEAATEQQQSESDDEARQKIRFLEEQVQQLQDTLRKSSDGQPSTRAYTPSPLSRIASGQNSAVFTSSSIDFLQWPLDFSVSAAIHPQVLESRRDIYQTADELANARSLPKESATPLEAEVPKESQSFQKSQQPENQSSRLVEAGIVEISTVTCGDLGSKRKLITTSGEPVKRHYETRSKGHCHGRAKNFWEQTTSKRSRCSDSGDGNESDGDDDFALPTLRSSKPSTSSKQRRMPANASSQGVNEEIVSANGTDRVKKKRARQPKVAALQPIEKRLSG
ncbi:hypothetical protein EDD11_004197 [Mortierella claussenii]|nr:hypothetical protein EDD11_004197 [Mortierella claussenii]